MPPFRFGVQLSGAESGAAWRATARTVEDLAERTLAGDGEVEAVKVDETLVADKIAAIDDIRTQSHIAAVEIERGNRGGQ